MAKGYTTRQEIENYLLITIDSSFYDQITQWIAEIESYIDTYTGRNFVAAATASARKFDGTGKGSVLIDDCVEITKVEYGEEAPLTEIVAGDYLVYPSNTLPKNKISLRYSVFPEGLQNVQITAKWGYSVAVPDQIKFIATVFVSGIINYSLNAEGEVSSISVGRYTVSYKDDKQWQDFDRANKMLDMLRKITF